MTMIRETYVSCDYSSVGLTLETDPIVNEVSVSINGADEAVCLAATQVGAIIKQLTTWLADRA